MTLKKPAKSKTAKSADTSTLATPDTPRFPIVGIGASAGGLEALDLFLKNVPPNCGMAFVIVQHLDPTHKGIMVELLQRTTFMPVAQVIDRMKIKPDHVYVIPPNRDLSILHGVLHLLEPVAPRGLRLPIDFFLCSLAEDQQEHSIGVILSGMGSDGTLGLRAIKEKAGAVFVQELTSAKFDGMPRSAIDAGLVDIVAPAEELASNIIAYLQHVNKRECRAVVLDITERKRAEDTLRETKQFINSIIHFTQDIIAFKDNDFIFRVVNPAMCNLVGKAENEIIGKTDFDIFPYELAEKYRNDDKHIIESGQSINIEEEVSSYNGIRYVSTTKAPVLNENNACQGIVIIVRDITERKLAQEALLESEGKYRALFEEEKNAIFVYAPETMLILDANPAMSSTYGYSYEEFIGMNCLELSAEVGESLKTVATDDKDGRFKADFRWHKKKDGVVFPVELAACSTVLNGKTIKFVIINDITKRKQAEKSLKDSEGRQRILLDNIQTQIWYLTDETTYGTLNKAHADFNGVKIEDMAFRNIYDIFPKENADACRQSNTEVFSTKKTVRTEEWMPHVSGEQRLITIIKNPILRDDGTVEYVVCSAEDITERKLIEKTLQESEEKYGIIFDQSPVAIEFYDALGGLIIVNEACLELFGIVDKNEISGFKLFEDPHISDEIKAELLNNRSVRFEGEFNFEEIKWLKLYQTTCSGIKILDWSISPLIVDDLLIGYVEQIQDITETKQFEIALQDSHAELEARVRERTLALQKTYEQLLHAEKMSSIGKLSASIAHEFNNPLQGVTSIIQGVKKRADMDHDDAELMDLAIKECHRMRDLIKSLQDFNRPTSARKAPMDIHAALESILMLSKKEYATRKISITKKYAENLPQIIAVSDQLKQVFLNLLSNASDACVQGGDVRIETDSVEDNVVIRVHDTGCGISPDDREHIFDPFFTTKAEIKGTGLGLSVSYGIVKAHGGEITVDSEPGKGTTFSVVLPIKGGSDEEK